MSIDINSEVMIGVILSMSLFHSVSKATTVFDSDGIIQDGDICERVEIHEPNPPQRTIVDMYGGVVGELLASDASTFNMYGGSIQGLWGYETSILNIYGGETELLVAGQSSVFNISDSARITFEIHVGDTSTFNVSGGDMTGIYFGLSSSGHISGGVISSISTEGDSYVEMTGGDIGCIYAYRNSSLSIYGYGFHYDPNGGYGNQGLLSGFWLDGKPFAIEVDEDSFPHINLVPEPSMFWLLVAGVAGFMNRKKHDDNRNRIRNR